MAGTASPRAGAFAPFGHRAFALLWTATLVSNIGTWMHEVGAAWLMTRLSPDPSVVVLVQAATTLPVFLFALLAGTLADRLDRRAMLIAINLALAVVIAAFALLVAQEAMTPALLVLLTFAIGTGAAFMAPAWQAVVPSLVPRAALKPAIALNSMGINVSRAIGPAIAGVLITGAAAAMPFALNAASHLVIAAALLLWRPAPAAPRHHGGLLADMATGLRHVRHNRPMRATCLRALAFFLFASAYWALLPLIAQRVPEGGAQLYGTLMALIGAGAVLGALVLPGVQARFGSERLARAGTLGTALALGIMAAAGGPAGLAAAALLGGVSWIAMLTALNVSAQTALPDWVRARGLSVFLTVFYGSMALGSVLWGQVAALGSVPLALGLAAAGLVAGLPLALRLPVGQGEALDLAPALAWPAPPVPQGQGAAAREAVVTVEYRVAPDAAPAFLAALRDLRGERLRDGASGWDLLRGVEDPAVWVETFRLADWAEHVEQHARVTGADLLLHARARAFDIRPGGPVVRHFLVER